MATSLFNTPDGAEFGGIQADAEFGNLLKAKKGTPQYDEWLRKYQEKRGKKVVASKDGAVKQILKKEEQSTPSKFIKENLIPRKDPTAKDGLRNVVLDTEKRLCLKGSHLSENKNDGFERVYPVARGKLKIWADEEVIPHRYEATERFYSYGISFIPDRPDRGKPVYIQLYYSTADNRWVEDYIDESSLNELLSILKD